MTERDVELGESALRTARLAGALEAYDLIAAAFAAMGERAFTVSELLAMSTLAEQGGLYRAIEGVCDGEVSGRRIGKLLTAWTNRSLGALRVWCVSNDPPAKVWRVGTNDG